MTPDGRAAAVWVEYPQDTPGGAWLAVRPGLDATPLGSGSGAPAVAAAGNGDVVAAWLADRAVRAAIWTPGAGLGSAVTLGDTDDNAPPVVSAAPDGRAVVVWNNGAEMRIAERPGGGAFGAAATLGAGEIGDAAVGADTTLAYFDQQGLMAARWSTQGGLTAATRISVPPGPFYVPSVAVDAAGGALVAFRENDHGRVALRSAAGSWATAELGAPRTRMLAATSASGDAVVAWVTLEDGAAGYMRAALADLGTGFVSAPFDVSKGRVDDLGGFALALSAGGDGVVAWTDAPSWDVVAARRPPGGIFAPPDVAVCANVGVVFGVGVDAAGAAGALTGDRVGSPAAARLVRDTTEEMAPKACPRPGGIEPTYEPYPVAGRETTIDASGKRNPEAVSTTYRWDLDHDGAYEIDSGADPRVRHTWATAGRQPWRLEVQNTFEDGATFPETYELTAVVGSADPVADPPAVTLTVPPEQRLRALLRRGLLVTVSANRSGSAHAELWASRRQARRLRLARHAVRLVRQRIDVVAGTPASARLRPGRPARRALRRAAGARLRVDLVRGTALLATAPWQTP